MLSYLLIAAILAFQVGARPVNPDLRDIFAALLKAIDPESDSVLLAARSLDRDAATALRAVRPGAIVHTDTEVAFPLPDFVLVIDSVTVSGTSAVVRLTRGPVPSEVGWNCGRAVTVPLRRTDRWNVLPENEFRVRCVMQGPRGLPADRERLLEAARLAFTTMHLGPRVRIVADQSLSVEALATLESFKEVSPSKLFETEKAFLPADVFVVRKLERNADLVEVEGTLGPVPRNSTLSCGTNWNIRLRRHADGWSFEQVQLTVC